MDVWTSRAPLLTPPNVHTSKRPHVDMLEIKNLHANVEGHEILKGIDLTVEAGEVHAIMGPNGSGKSTLANVLAGREEYEITEGSVTYNGQDLLDMAPEERARDGVFLAFQYPVELPGVSTMQFLRTAVNSMREHRGEGDMNVAQFMKLMREKADFVNLDHSLMKRSVNEGFSGGEKKRAEIFQMAMLDPKLAILDETDSGLDIDALKIVSEGVNKLRGPGARVRAHHALPTPPQLHRPRRGPHPDGRPHREVRRQRARARARSEGLRLDPRARRRHRRCVTLPPLPFPPAP